MDSRGERRRWENPRWLQPLPSPSPIWPEIEETRRKTYENEGRIRKRRGIEIPIEREKQRERRGRCVGEGGAGAAAPQAAVEKDEEVRS